MLFAVQELGWSRSCLDGRKSGMIRRRGRGPGSIVPTSRSRPRAPVYRHGGVRICPDGRDALRMRIIGEKSNRLEMRISRHHIQVLTILLTLLA